MGIVINVIFIILGFLLLIKGADIFVDGISSTAVNFKIPKLIISLSIVAFGTSAPELAISFQGLLNGTGDVVLANVVGSTIVNTLLIIGIAAIVRPIKVKHETIKKQLPLHLITILVFALLFSFDQKVQQTDAFILVMMFLYFVFYIFKFAKRQTPLFSPKEKPKWNLWVSIIYSILGLAAIIWGSDIAVDNCIELAYAIGISEKLITMFILVIGTSTPELVLAITSAKKNEFDIILGNIIGTNIFNIGFVLGLPVLLIGSVSSLDFTMVDMFAMVLAGVYLYEYAKDDRILTKKEGIFMVAVFVVYYAYIIINGV